MTTYVIILPVDRNQSRQLARLLDMFGQNAVLSYREIESVIPKATFRQLIYKLKLIETYVWKKFGFKLFEFKTVDGRKVMQAAAKMEFAEIEGTEFVVFKKVMEEQNGE